MEKKWYVLHVLSGKEGAVRESILRRAQQAEMSAFIGDILVPTEKVSEVKQGKRTTQTRKFFPGYVLIEAALFDAEKKLLHNVWEFVRETPGVMRFIGDQRPVPLRQDEIDTVLQQVEEKQERVKPKVEFEPGEVVKIIDGPFMGLSDVRVDKVDPERGKLWVMVMIFGSEHEVELEYWQVERVD